MSNLNKKEALRVTFDCDFGENVTVREYLAKLLETLWLEGENFNGKRPFGNSGWQDELYKPLIMNGYIEGKLDEDGYVEEIDYGKADKFVCELITYIFHGY